MDDSDRDPCQWNNKIRTQNIIDANLRNVYCKISWYLQRNPRLPLDFYYTGFPFKVKPIDWSFIMKAPTSSRAEGKLAIPYGERSRRFAGAG